MITAHILERISQRVTDNHVANMILATAVDKAARYGMRGTDVAIIVGRTATPNGTLTYCADGTGESNGTLFVIIVRDTRIVTAMWRREAQPWTTAALRVDKIIGRVSRV